jgi:pimeloyl-ACP methyl ester carboxylesterase
MSDPFKTHHIAPTLYDEKGRPYCEALFTPKSDTKRYICIVPPEKVIPVIFVPGIMGSNLRMKTPLTDDEFRDLKGMAWWPDDKKFMAVTYRGKTASQRRRILDPANTDVANIAELDADSLMMFKQERPTAAALENWKNEFKRRRWGTAMLSSYGSLLCHLEYNLNRIYYQGNINPYWHNQIKDRVALDFAGTRKELDWGRMTGFVPLTDDELTKAARYWYPVHACGYNWLRSNGEAGKHLAAYIDEVLGHYKKHGYKSEKVILVTHSMGGLVARAACHAKMGNAENKVLGIVHGVMPANGAGAAYKRQHAGFEAGTTPISLITAQALGWTGPEVAAVFSNSPGALQLLPNKRYGANWLRFEDTHRKLIYSLPEADPYAEIYREPNKWWRLMNPAWIDPVKARSSERTLSILWKDYLLNLGEAEVFHDDLADYYHPRTYTHYGADPKQAAWASVTWRENGDWTWSPEHKLEIVKNGLLQSANALGNVMVRAANAEQAQRQVWDSTGTIRTEHSGWRAELVPASDPGDGTVPAVSGAAPQPKSKLTAAMTGFDHQGSYANTAVQELVLHNIAKLAQEAT